MSANLLAGTLEGNLDKVAEARVVSPFIRSRVDSAVLERLSALELLAGLLLLSWREADVFSREATARDRAGIETGTAHGFKALSVSADALGRLLRQVTVLGGRHPRWDVG